MEEKNYITVCMLFKIKDSEDFGGIGSVGYLESNFEVSSKLYEEISFQKYVEMQKELKARLHKVPVESIQVISKKEYEECCMSAAPHSLESEAVSSVKLREPKEYEKPYFTELAEHLATFFYGWFLNDFTLIDKSSQEIKQEWEEDDRTCYFFVADELMSAKFFDDYVQLKDKYGCIGNFEWSYLASETWSQWNTKIRKTHEDFFKSGKYREIFEKSVEVGRNYIKSKNC